MYPSVRQAFPSFTKQFEGDIRFMYLDVKGLVTTGKGNLIDPMDGALGITWQHKKTGIPATRDEVIAEWKLVKSRQDLKNTFCLRKGSFVDITTLEISQATLDELVSATLTSFEKTLKKYFPDFDKWPADAELGVLSMAWALGPGFPAAWPKFKAACLADDWEAAADNCRISETGNPGVHPRNLADKQLFTNAACVEDSSDGAGYKSDVLYYPTMLFKPLVVTP